MDSCGQSLTQPNAPRPSAVQQAGVPLLLDQLVHDLRLAARSLARDRAFSAAAVATLALGVGAITALAAIVSGVLLSPLPYRIPIGSSPSFMARR